MIKVEHLKKEYENSTPLKDINLTINDGEAISIIGPSGTGKSTFLRCLNLLEKPTSGHIWIDNEEVTGKDAPIYKLRQKIGFVFQSFNLYGHLTAVENVMYAQVKLLNKSRQEAYDNSMKLLESVGLASHALQYESSLSGGQKQRVAIARTLALDPDIILFDEPTSALDPLMVEEVAGVIYELKKQGKTMIIVTHEMEFAKKISSRVLFFADGIVYEEGTPEKIFDNPQKEKTKQFMKNADVCTINIILGLADYAGVMSEVKKFVIKQNLENSYIHKLQLLIEEFMISFFKTFANKKDCMRIILKYDRSIDKVICSFLHNLDKSIFDNYTETISIKIIESIPKAVREKELTDGEFKRMIEYEV